MVPPLSIDRCRKMNYIICAEENQNELLLGTRFAKLECATGAHAGVVTTAPAGAAVRNWIYLYLQGVFLVCTQTTSDKKNGV